jgi:TetR/AcrR family transcriptional regulator, cholesterol catabolism regulator
MARNVPTRTPPARRKPVAKRRAAAAPLRIARPSLAFDEGPRGRILRAAAHLFVTRGYGQSTVRDLARAVGILSGSIFHHFESKEEILESVMSEVSARSTERMQKAVAAAGGPLARVRALIRCELESIHGDSGEAMTLLVSEWRSLGAAAQARVLVLRDRYEQVWLTALRAARRELAPIDPFILRRLLHGMISATANWYRPRGPISIDALTASIFSLVERRAGAR